MLYGLLTSVGVAVGSFLLVLIMGYSYVYLAVGLLAAVTTGVVSGVLHRFVTPRAGRPRRRT